MQEKLENIQQALADLKNGRGAYRRSLAKLVDLIHASHNANVAAASHAQNCLVLCRLSVHRPVLILHLATLRAVFTL
jgi:hypothetical protein